jgi:hypothetical protein
VDTASEENGVNVPLYPKLNPKESQLKTSRKRKAPAPIFAGMQIPVPRHTLYPRPGKLLNY